MRGSTDSGRAQRPDRRTLVAMPFEDRLHLLAPRRGRFARLPFAAPPAEVCDREVAQQHVTDQSASRNASFQLSVACVRSRATFIPRATPAPPSAPRSAPASMPPPSVSPPRAISAPSPVSAPTDDTAHHCRLAFVDGRVAAQTARAMRASASPRRCLPTMYLDQPIGASRAGRFRRARPFLARALAVPPPRRGVRCPACARPSQPAADPFGQRDAIGTPLARPAAAIAADRGVEFATSAAPPMPSRDASKPAAWRRATRAQPRRAARSPAPSSARMRRAAAPRARCGSATSARASALRRRARRRAARGGPSGSATRSPACRSTPAPAISARDSRHRPASPTR